MVIAYVREVISWETIALEDDDVGVVVLEFDLAADSVDEGSLSIMVAIGIEADDPWGASFDPYSVVESVKDEVDGDLARVESEPKENGNGWYTITGGFDTNVSKNYPLTLVACDKNGNKVTQEFSLYVKPQPAVAEKKPSVGSQQSANVDNARDYVLNSNPDRMRFHKPTCGDVKKISAKNRQDVHMTREEVIAMGYTPCGHCHP